MPVDPHLFLAFTLTTFVAMVVPGPDMLFVLSCGMRGGARAGLFATTGVATSEALHIAVAAAGLSTLFAAVPGAATVVRLLGAAYLVFIGVRIIRNRANQNDAPEASTGIPARTAYLTGLWMNLLNPKMITFSIAFLPQFIDAGWGDLRVQFAVLGATLVALEFLVDGTISVLGAKLGAWLQRRESTRRRLNAATGGLFILLGIGLTAAR